MITPSVEFAAKLVDLLWACSQTKSQQSPQFRVFIKGRETLQGLFDAAGVEVAPNLEAAMSAPALPTSAELGEFPSEFTSHWLLYFLKFQKEGEPDKVYAGTGTNPVHGGKQRIRDYKPDHGSSLSSLCAQAFRDGYKITKICTVLRIPLPRIEFQPELRLLMLVFEDAFTHYFRLMRSRTRDYFMSLSPWPLASRNYDGLCTHGAMSEAQGLVNLPLTVDERIQKAKVSADKHRENSKISMANWRDRLTDAERKALRESDAARWALVKTDVQKKAFYDRIWKERCRKSRAANKDAYKCHICPRTFNRQDYLDYHVAFHDGKLAKSKPMTEANLKRRKTADALKKKNKGAFPCLYCDKKWDTNGELRRHMATHSTDKPFKCECGSAHNTREYLRTHCRRYNHKSATPGVVF